MFQLNKSLQRLIFQISLQYSTSIKHIMMQEEVTKKKANTQE